jgi:acyl-coenzyme A thioesterase PaaI-like protein
VSSRASTVPRQICKRHHMSISNTTPTNIKFQSTPNMAEEGQEPDLAHFQNIPWCAQLLSSSNIVITPTNSREYKASTEDALFAETFKTDDTIRACLSFYSRPAPGIPRIEEIHTLLALGYRLNGYPARAHGGVIATLIDEEMGMLLSVNKKLGFLGTQGDTVTAYLNVTYLKPVETPGTVLVSARFREVTGRKYFLEAMIKAGSGEVLAKAEALWIGLEKSNSKEKL